MRFFSFQPNECVSISYRSRRRRGETIPSYSSEDFHPEQSVRPNEHQEPSSLLRTLPWACSGACTSISYANDFSISFILDQSHGEANKSQTGQDSKDHPAKQGENGEEGDGDRHLQDQPRMSETYRNLIIDRCRIVVERLGQVAVRDLSVVAILEAVLEVGDGDALDIDVGVTE